MALRLIEHATSPNDYFPREKDSGCHIILSAAERAQLERGRLASTHALEHDEA
jgi:hypothetical protein